MSGPRIGFAGQRQLGLRVLDYLTQNGFRPLVLMVNDAQPDTRHEELINRCSYLKPGYIWRNNEFRSPESLGKLRALDLDFLVCIHFPYMIPQSVLDIPKVGVLNLHPSYLPYNRGWHTPSWAILEETPYGGTLHFMDRSVDTGDIIHQKQLKVLPGDTANALYPRALDLEFEVFREAWPQVASGKYARIRQDPKSGTSHSRKELPTPKHQKLDLNETVRAGDLLRRLRALTTSVPDEAAYYDVDGVRHYVSVSIHEAPIEPPAQ